MKVSVPAHLMAGIALVGASAIAITPMTAAPPDSSPPRTAAVHLTAQSRPLLARSEVFAALVTMQQQANQRASTVSVVVPEPPAAPTASLVAFPDLADAIIATYEAVEPWVAYGVSLAQYAVGWIPGVGLLAPQIGIFYNLGESIVQSAVFNIADVIGGQALIPALTDFVNESFAAFVNFVNAEIAWVLSFLPPLPPLPLAAPEPAEELVTASLAEVEPQPDRDVTAKVATTEVTEPVAETEIEETAAEQAEPAAKDIKVATAVEDTKEIEDVDDTEEVEEARTTSSGTVEAQGEVRETGISASPDETADNATASAPNNDTPNVRANPTNAVPADDDSVAQKQVSSPDSGGATAQRPAAASRAP